MPPAFSPTMDRGNHRKSRVIVTRRQASCSPAIMIAGGVTHPRRGIRMRLLTRRARWIAAGTAAVCALMVVPAIALASAAAPTRSAAAARAPSCETPGLVIWLDTNGNAAAGTAFFKLHFTNLFGHACTLNGFPFLFAVNLKGHQVGRRAVFRRPAPRLVRIPNG